MAKSRYSTLIHDAGPTYFGGGTQYSSHGAHTERSKLSNSKNYAEILVNPFSNKNAQIPDISSYPTCTYTQVEELSVAVGNTSTTNTTGGVNFIFAAAPVYQLETNASSDSPIVYAPQVAFTGNAQVQALYARHRLVACGVYCEYTGTDNENKGIVFTGYFSRRESPPSALTALQNTRDGYSGPLKFGAYMRYRPFDPQDLQFRPTADLTQIWAQMQFHFNGAQPQAVLRFRIVCHWEGVTATDTAPNSQNVLWSPSDLGGYETAINHVQMCATTGGFSEGIASITKEGKKILDMIDYDMALDIAEAVREVAGGSHVSVAVGKVVRRQVLK